MQILPKARVERGAILILVMLVLLVLATVIMQIWFTADVDKQIAVYQKNSFPIRQAAQGAYMNACSILMQDMQEGASGGGEDGGGMFGGGGDEGGGEDGSEGEGSEGGEEGGEGGDPSDSGEGDEAGSSMTDSLVDSWAQPGESGLAFTSDVEVQVLIRDEDAKFNILSILSRDEEFQEKSMDRLVRIIDLFREETRGDLSYGTAREISEAIKDWMHGDRKSDDFPTPFVKTGPRDGEDDERDDDYDDESREYPLTIEELVLCEDVTADILYGYMDGRERIPGLIEYITIYSNLIMDTPRPDEEETDVDDMPDPWDGGENDASDNDVPDEDASDSDEEDREQEDEIATETNNGLININTAPIAVLKALLEDSDIPYSVLDELEEFRVKAIEKYHEDMDDAGWGDDETRFGDTADSRDDDDDDDDDDGSAFDDDEDEDFIFKDPYNVLTRIEEYFETSFDIEEDIKSEFCSLLSVKSNVFTVYVIVKSSDGRNVKNYRAVVWRRAEGGEGTEGSEMDGDMSGAITGGGNGQIVTLVPLEEYPHPIPYRADELEALETGYY